MKPERGIPMRIREYWSKLMDSTQRKMSRGASNLSKIISWARNENWRRKEKKK
jgi:hypothetical protein